MIGATKLVKGESRAKGKLVFLFDAEPHPNLGMAKFGERRAKSLEMNM